MNQHEILYRAISSGIDLETLDQCMRTITASSLVEFEAWCGESVLHVAVQAPYICSERRLEMINRLIANPAVDCSSRNREGLTPLELAVQLEHKALAGEMILAILKRFGLRQTFYTTIRRGSLAVCKVLLETISDKVTEREIFQLVCSAIIELNAKHVLVPPDVTVLMQELLSRYAYQHLSGDSFSRKQRNGHFEWRQHLDAIIDSWNFIRDRCGPTTFGAISNAFLLRLEIIHNNLYFVKHKPWLKHLPLLQLVICLAVFISIFKPGNSFDVYKLVLNKRILLNFVGAVSEHLMVIMEELETVANRLREIVAPWKSRTDCVSAERRAELLLQVGKITCVRYPENVVNRLAAGLKKNEDTEITIASVLSDGNFDWHDKLNTQQNRSLKRLLKSYNQVQQVRAIKKIIHALDVICDLPANSNDTQQVLIRMSCVKRVMQMIGESTKNTRQSPNMPLCALLLQGMHKLNFHRETQMMREWSGHAFSLGRLLANPTEEDGTFSYDSAACLNLRAFYQALDIFVVYDLCQRFCGIVRDCSSIAELRELLLYVGNLENIEQMQLDQCQMLQEYCRQSDDAASESSGFVKILHDIVNELCHVSQCENFINLGDLRVRAAVTDASTLAAVRNMAVLKIMQLKMKNTYENFDGIFQVENIGSDFIWRICCMQKSVHATMVNNRSSQTDEIFRELGIQEIVADSIRDELNEKMQKYYDDVFVLDMKYCIVRQFLKCNKIEYEDRKLNAMRRDDQRKLQTFFDIRRARLMSILTTYGCTGLDSLPKVLATIPAYAVAALEYCQLELCEILKSVRYFGDNLGYLQQRIPIVQGRNYRNYLAHDSLSYDILADVKQIAVVNGYVMATIPVELFPVDTSTIIPELPWDLPTVSQLIAWVDVQEKLYAATIRNDFDLIHQLVTELGAAIEGRFYTTDSNCIEQLAHVFDHSGCNQEMLLYFKRLLPDVDDPFIRVLSSLRYVDYASALSVLLKHEPKLLFQEPCSQLFCRKNIIQTLRVQCALLLEDTSNRGQILIQLIKNGNDAAVRDLLLEFPVNSEDLNAALDMAALCYSLPTDTLTLLLERNATVTLRSLFYALIAHADSCDTFTRLADIAHSTLFTDKIGLLLAFECCNFPSIRWLIERNFYSKKHLNEHLDELLANTVVNRQPKIMKFLLNLVDISGDFKDKLKICVGAMQRESWACLRLLVTHIDMHMPFPCTVCPKTTTIYLELVRSGAWKIIRRLTKPDTVCYRRHRQYTHPLCYALRHMNEPMVKYMVRQNGFHYLHSSAILQVAILTKSDNIIGEILNTLRELQDEWKTIKDSKLALVAQVLSRWSTFGYLEEPSYDHLVALSIAAKTENYPLVETLLELSLQARSIGGLGLVNCIGFTDGNDVTWCDRDSHCSFSVMLDGCESMIARITTAGDIKWQETSLDKSRMQMWYCGELKPSTNLGSGLATIKDAMGYLLNIFEPVPIAYAIYEDTYFLKLNDRACIFDVEPRAQLSNDLLKSLVNHSSTTDSSPMWSCESHWNTDIIAMLLSYGADPRVIHETKLWAPIHSIIVNSSDTAMVLLEYCVKHGMKSALGLPYGTNIRPIYLSTITTDDCVMQFLLNNGISGTGDSAMLATKLNHINKLRMLLEYDRTLLNERDDTGWTVAHFSARYSVDSLEVLLPLQMDITTTDNLGITPVGIAVQVENVQWLKKVCRWLMCDGHRDVLVDSDRTAIRNLAERLSEAELLALVNDDSVVFKCKKNVV